VSVREKSVGSVALEVKQSGDVVSERDFCNLSESAPAPAARDVLSRFVPTRQRNDKAPAPRLVLATRTAQAARTNEFIALSLG